MIGSSLVFLNQQTISYMISRYVYVGVQVYIIYYHNDMLSNQLLINSYIHARTFKRAAVEIIGMVVPVGPQLY